MKIIRHGEQAAFTFVGSCDCGCQFECDTEELNRRGNYEPLLEIASIECPECGCRTRLEKKEKQPSQRKARK